MTPLIWVFLLLGPGAPPELGIEDGPSVAEQERLDDALETGWQKAIAERDLGFETEPVPVKINLTYYWPPDGGINCNGDCTHVGASAIGESVDKWVGTGGACPIEIPRGSKVTFTPEWWDQPVTVTCVDSGGAITSQSDGSIDIDWLTDEPIWGITYDAMLELPDPFLICPNGKGCERPIVIPHRLHPPWMNEIDLPTAVCPVSSCNPWLVKLDSRSTPGKIHSGVDLWTGSGGEVRAPWDALVVFCGVYDQYGDMCALDYGNGWWSRLGHVRSVVSTGETVKAGQLIGHVNDSGYTLDGEHVHFELWWGWTPYDILRVIEVADGPPVTVEPVVKEEWTVPMPDEYML